MLVNSFVPDKFGWKILLLSLVVLVASPCDRLLADETVDSPVESLVEKYRVIQKDVIARASAIKKGKDLALLCAYCHGEDGNSTKPRFPNLASQNPVYLLDQFERFRTGLREDFTGVMSSLVKNMSNGDQVALAIYYTNSPLKAVKSDPVFSKRGKPVYEKYCQQCHGENGQGTKGYARIAGQQTVYLIETFDLFKGTNGQAGTRHSDIMATMSSLLTKEGIRGVAHYLTSLLPRPQFD